MIVVAGFLALFFGFLGSLHLKSFVPISISLFFKRSLSKGMCLVKKRGMCWICYPSPISVYFKSLEEVESWNTIPFPNV